MREIRTSGLMSGEGRRSQGEPDCGGGPEGPPTATGRLPPPRPSSTLQLGGASGLWIGDNSSVTKA